MYFTAVDLQFIAKIEDRLQALEDKLYAYADQIVVRKVESPMLALPAPGAEDATGDTQMEAEKEMTVQEKTMALVAANKGKK